MLLEELRTLGRWEETTVVLASDHGFLPVTQETRVGTFFRTLGLLDVDVDGRIATWRAYFWQQGGSAAIYLHPQATHADPRRVDDVIRLLQSNPTYGVGRAYRAAEVTALGGLPGAYAVLDALPGFSFGRAVDAGPIVVPKTGGTHGHHPGRPETRAAFIISGPRIARGKALGLVRLLDVAPTLAQILNVNLGQVEGRVLTEIFAPKPREATGRNPAR